LMTELSPGTSPPPVRMPIRWALSMYCPALLPCAEVALAS
jgi:hypothetical protein